jgi:threonine dehydratase
VIVQDILAQMGSDRPTHTFLPVGVGGLTGAIVALFWC